MEKNKIIKIVIIAILGVALIIEIGYVINIKLQKDKKTDIQTSEVKAKLKELPNPEITGGSRGELGIDKNINESTIDEYLNREDSVYRDMRMLEDPGNYEAIGGDRFLSGYVEGFEVIPLPYIIPVTGLPSAVGETYTGTTLFYNDNGTYKANYAESMSIIEKLFPKDKVIFLMCGGGGYAGMTKNFLISLGWDENKIYNTGGYWYYKGEHNISVKQVKDGKVSFDFDSVPYHKIEFDKLTKTSNYKEPEVKVTEVKINTSKIEIEEGTSFTLSSIVLPNEAANKEVKWTSSDETIVTVTNNGIVKAIKEGKATIIVETVDGNKKAACDVIVNKRIVNTTITLDNLNSEAEEFKSYDLNLLVQKFEAKIYDSHFSLKEEYYTIDEQGNKIVNEVYKEEYKKHEKNLAEANRKRIEIFNKLIDNKKSFIVIIEDNNCGGGYDVAEAAKRILDQKNITYFNVSTPAGGGNGDESFFSSKIDTSDYKAGAIAIIKEGTTFATSDPNVDALNNEETVLNWLSKYIEL